ncbi:hypothetical protein HY29_03890 [Hyphomonas beringensis]|uniref:Methylamine utilization protein MauE n=2 Tax=Hyphomonas beringensis TaxID=1280946 RepID=A0A062U6J5_9PROT|nr:hypothetical protein HY29_03890 [Hyphomonas beringensis]
MSMDQSMLTLLQMTAAVFLALLFLRAALHKLGDRYRFEGILADYGLIPETALSFIVFAAPILELAAAVMLIIPSVRPVGAALAASLLTGYAIAMAINLVRDHRMVDCGCGGAPEPISWKLVVRNAVLVGLIAPTAMGWTDPIDSSLALDVTSLGIGTLVLLLWMTAETMLANDRRMNEDLPGPATTWSTAQ